MEAEALSVVGLVEIRRHRDESGGSAPALRLEKRPG
jgi:hypothetical protein